MYPDLISIGPFTIHTYGLLVAAGLVAALLVTVRMGEHCGIAAQQVMDMAFAVILCAILGSRVAYILTEFSFYRHHPLETLKIWEGGLVFSGGLISGFLAMLSFAWIKKLSLWKLADMSAPGLALGQGIGRIGCYMAGCCYGRPTDAVWGVVFRHPESLAPLNISLHPTQLYAALSGLILFAILFVLHKRRAFEGQVSLWYLILNSTSRLLVERFRGDDRGLIPGSAMTVTQLVTTLILIAAVITLLVLNSRNRERRGQP